MPKSIEAGQFLIILVTAIGTLLAQAGLEWFKNFIHQRERRQESSDSVVIKQVEIGAEATEHLHEWWQEQVKENQKLFEDKVKADARAVAAEAHVLELEKDNAKALERIDLLEAALRAEKTIAEAAIAKSRRDGPPRILVVDDEDGIRDMMVQVLGIEGFEVQTASNAIEALNLLGDGETYDLLIVDLGLPQMKGHNMISILHQLGSTGGAQIVIFSGIDKKQAREIATRLKVPLWHKPLMGDEIVRRVRELVGE